MYKYPSRPTATPEIIAEAAKKVAKSMGADPRDLAEWAEGIAEAYSNGNRVDGFEIAKVLDAQGWNLDANDVTELNDLHDHVKMAVDRLCKAWVEENDIQPPFEAGTAIKQGVIAGVYGHKPAYYMVKEHGCTNDNRHLLVKFEDAKPVESEL